MDIYIVIEAGNNIQEIKRAFKDVENAKEYVGILIKINELEPVHLRHTFKIEQIELI